MKQICGDNNFDEYPIINSIAKIAFIITVSNAWPERGGSTIKRIKTNKKSALKSDALNALIMTSINRSICGTPEALYLIKQASISFGEQTKRCKKAPAVKEKETSTQTLVSRTQTEILHVEPESQIDTDEYFDAITTSDKYIVDSSGTDSDDD